MVRVMDKLDIPIPPFILHWRLVVELHTTGEGRHKLNVYGVDVDGTPVTFLRSVKLVNNRRLVRSEPFEFALRDNVPPGPNYLWNWSSWVIMVNLIWKLWSILQTTRK
jgi:mono-ADP-ribosyltransferase sirtuin 6